MSTRRPIDVCYGVKVLRHEAHCRIERGKPRIPFVGAILDFITHPLVWYPGWISLALYALTKAH